MAYEPTAATISQAALIGSSRTRAITPHATAPTTATADQMAMDLARMATPPDGCVRIHPHEPGQVNARKPAVTAAAMSITTIIGALAASASSAAPSPAAR